MTRPRLSGNHFDPTEVGITDRREKELSDLGFLSLCHYKNTDYAVFFGAGGHGKVVADAALAAGFTVEGFLDDAVQDGAPTFCEGTAPYMSPAVARGEVEDRAASEDRSA